MATISRRLASPLDAPAATVLVRLVVGWVFLSEGIQKFLYPERLGEGRFDTIGIPSPGFTAPLVGVVEVACGALLVLGLATRLATVPLVVDIAVAIATTKVPVLWGGSDDIPDGRGFWSFAHESRTDVAMLAGLAFLFLVGPGRLSLDAAIRRRAVG